MASKLIQRSNLMRHLSFWQPVDHSSQQRSCICSRFHLGACGYICAYTLWDLIYLERKSVLGGTEPHVVHGGAVDHHLSHISDGHKRWTVRKRTNARFSINANKSLKFCPPPAPWNQTLIGGFCSELKTSKSFTIRLTVPRRFISKWRALTHHRQVDLLVGWLSLFTRRLAQQEVSFATAMLGLLPSLHF